MKSIDMFFPIGKKTQEERVNLPNPLPKGIPLSPHILTFRKNGKNDFLKPPSIKSPSSPFQTKRIPESEKDIPLEIQMEKTKRILGMNNDFSNLGTLKKSPSSAFFRNLRSMFSLGIFALGSLLILSASANAFYTAQNIKQTARNSVEMVFLNGFEAMKKGDFQKAQQIFQNAEQSLSSADFFFRFTPLLNPQISPMQTMA